jgi:putative intracellular protease/amidase
LPPPAPKGKIGLLIEAKYVEDEVQYYRQKLTAEGYEAIFISYLWDQPYLLFQGEVHGTPIRVHTDFKDVVVEEYKGFILCAGGAMDRLRYEKNPRPGQPNHSPAVRFLRTINANPGLVIGVICHGLWLYCADRTLLEGREVTCAQNIMYDVQNAGGVLQYNAAGDETAITHVDGHDSAKATMVTGQHPAVVVNFVDLFLQEIAKKAEKVAPSRLTRHQNGTSVGVVAPTPPSEQRALGKKVANGVVGYGRVYTMPS